jgi:hypothetical protein
MAIGLGSLAVPTSLLFASSAPEIEKEFVPEWDGVGYKGQTEMDAGYFYAPYIPLGELSSNNGVMSFKTKYIPL